MIDCQDTLLFLLAGRLGEESGASTSEVSCSWISFRRARRLLERGIFFFSSVFLFLSVLYG